MSNVVGMTVKLQETKLGAICYSNHIASATNQRLHLLLGMRLLCSNIYVRMLQNMSHCVCNRLRWTAQPGPQAITVLNNYIITLEESMLQSLNEELPHKASS